MATTLNRGGAEKHLLDLAKAQRADGHAVHIAHLRQGFNYWENEVRKAGGEVTDLGLTSYLDFLPLLRLVQIIRGWRPDLIHAHLQPAEVYSRLALMFTGGRLPFFITKHNDERFFPGPGARGLGRWVARRARLVIAISEAVRQNTCLVDLGLPPSQVVTIPYGISPEPFLSVTTRSRLALRASLGLGEEDLAIGSIARFVPQKALHVLIEGFGIFRRQKGGGGTPRLVLIGRGPLEKSLRDQVAGLGLERDVVFGGFREDIPQVMGSLDIFALSSEYEGFGLVLLEAMAAGLPVVASKVSSIPEIVMEGKTGLLFPRGNPRGLADCLSQLRAPEIRKKMGEAGRQRVLAEFRLDRVWQQTRRAYGDVPL